MRTISTADSYLLQADSGRSALVRAYVKNAAGSFIDLSTYPGENFVLSATWGEDIDSNGMTANVTLFRGNELMSLSPLHETSPLNKGYNPAASYAALVLPGRDIVLETAIAPDGLPAAGLSWRESFRGKIDTVEFGDEKVQLTCRDQVAVLMDAYIEVDRAYAFAQGVSATKGTRIFEPSTAYVLNELVIPSETKLNGKWFKVTTAGTSASTEPTWPTTITNTVTSGSVVFTCMDTTSQASGENVETVMQKILTDNGTGVTLSTPSSPGWLIRAFHQERKSVWDAIRELATQIGWDLRYKWSGSAFVLTFVAPDRATTTALRTFSTTDVISWSSAKITVENIRNAVQVWFSDSQDRDASGVAKRKKVSVTDSTSIATYGRRWMEIQEGSTSNIDSTSEATTFANAALADLATPNFEGEPTLQFFPFVELNDYYEFVADGLRFTSNQKLAVVGYEHSIDEAGAKTTLRLRGKPSAGLIRWLRADGVVPSRTRDVHAAIVMSGINAFALAGESTPGGLTMTVDAAPSKLRHQRLYEYHLSQTSTFTPDDSTLVSTTSAKTARVTNLQPGDFYYAKVVSVGENDARITKSEPSEPVLIYAGYVEPAHLNPITVEQKLPPNGSFEGYRRGSSQPPDHWTMQVGTWTSDILQETTQVHSGTKSLKFAEKSGNNAIQSAIFPVRESYWYSLSCWLKRIGSTDDDVTLTVEWYDSTLTTVSDDAVTVQLTDYAAWKRLTRTYQAPTGATLAFIYITKAETGVYGFYVDDVEFVGAPDYTAAAGYVNNWTDYGSTYTPAGFTLTPEGTVRLRGLAKRSSGSPTLGETIFTLPEEAWPSTDKIFCVITDTGVGRLDISTAGVVKYITGGHSFLSLDGLSFDTR